MKQYLILILTIFICACSLNTRQKDSETETIIDILDADDFKKKLEFHKDREVRIYGSTYRMPGSESPNYALYIYRKGVGRTGNFIFWGHYKYDKAAYKWVNDSILNFRLFNSSNNLSDSYTYTYHNKYSECLGINSK